MASKEQKHYRVVGLPGDYIGAEVYAAAVRALDALTQDRDFRIELDEQLIGGAAVDATGEPLPQATLDACEGADAALLGDLRVSLAALPTDLSIADWQRTCRQRKIAHAWRYDAPGEGIYVPDMLRRISEADRDLTITCDVG